LELKRTEQLFYVEIEADIITWNIKTSEHVVRPMDDINPSKTAGELTCHGRISSSCSTQCRLNAWARRAVARWAHGHSGPILI
jgi:hypothetical protein